MRPAVIQMKYFPSATAWAFLTAALSLIEPRIAAAQLLTLRVGSNSPASTESAAEQAQLVTQMRAREGLSPSLVEESTKVLSDMRRLNQKDRITAKNFIASFSVSISQI